MRVAVVVRSLKIGGMERVAVNLSEAFADEGHESHLIYFKAKGKKLSPKESVILHHFNLEGSLKKTIIGLPFFLLAKLFNGLIRGSFFFYNGLLLAPIFKYKLKQIESKYGKFDLIIMRGHGTFEMIWPYQDERIIQMVESIFIRSKSSLDRFYLRCVYNNKHLAGVSLGVKEKIEELVEELDLKPRSVNVIYNPIDAATILKKANDYTIDMKEKYIVSVSRITPNKNIPFLLRAYKIARDRYKLDLALVIIGDGHDMQRVKQTIAELELDKDVKLLGLLQNPYPWIKNAQLLTSTSKAEGFGMVIVEALILDTQPLTTKSEGGIRDIMCNELSEYMVDFDEELFAQKMLKCVKTPKKIAYEKYTTPFSAKAITQAYLSFLQEKIVH